MRPLKVAIICEYSGVVRRAFREAGHDAYSFDLLPSDDDSPYHIQGDCLDQNWQGWDIGICHPPCTNIAVSGAKHFEKKGKEVILNSIRFALKLWNLPIPRLALENPIGLLSNWRKPRQIIQPWMFGHPETKATCLWLRGLPRLEPTIIRDVEDRKPRVHLESQVADRWKRRSTTLYGIALAMARQWGPLDWE